MFAESIDTDRFVLRVPKSTDGAAVYAAVADVIEQLRGQPGSWPWAGQEQSVAVSTIHCERARRNFDQGSKWSLFVHDRATEQVIGNAEFHTIHSELNMWELGVWTRPSWQHCGVMSEVLIKVLAWMKQNNPDIEVVIKIDANNHVSQKLAEKVGFKPVHEYQFESRSYKMYSSNPQGVEQ
jgi:RimJ/RimL family protein N-acetyltransferase